MRSMDDPVAVEVLVETSVLDESVGEQHSLSARHDVLWRRRDRNEPRGVVVEFSGKVRETRKRHGKLRP